MLGFLDNKFLIVVLLAVSIFSSCAIINEGKIDFRRTNVSHTVIDKNGTLVPNKGEITEGQILILKSHKSFKYKNIDINTSKLKTKQYENIEGVYNILIDESLITKQVNQDINRSVEKEINKFVTEYLKYLDKFEKNKSDEYIPKKDFQDVSENISLNLSKVRKNQNNDSFIKILKEKTKKDNKITLNTLVDFYNKHRKTGLSPKDEENDKKSIYLKLSDTSKEYLNDQNRTKKFIHIVNIAVNSSLSDLISDNNFTNRCDKAQKKLIEEKYLTKYKKDFFDREKTIKNKKIRYEIVNLLKEKKTKVDSYKIITEYKKQLKDEYSYEIKNNIAEYLYVDKKTYQELKVKNFSLGTDEDTRFIVGDSLSLHLRSAYIYDFSENGYNYDGPFGEIAIVANAFEELDGKEINFQNTGTGRVVFYSSNVHRGQMLNFNNMPIYGPLEYRGAPFAFRISILELDMDSEQSKNMLKTLSEAGSKAYPPASPVLSMLNGIGESLLSGSRNDLGFIYTMVLDSKGGSKKVNHFTLEVGNYVFVREENRTKITDWDNLVLDENKGVLYKKDENGNVGEVYTDGSYLIVEINKNVSNINVELAQNNFGDLIASLEKQDKEKAKNFKSIHESLMSAAVSRSQIYNFNKAKKILKNLDEEVPEVQKMEDLKELLKMIASSVKDGKYREINTSESVKAIDLSRDEVDYVMKKLREKAKGSSKIIYSEFNLLSIEKAFSNDDNKAKQTKIMDLFFEEEKK